MKIDFTVHEGRMPRGYALQVAEYLRGLEGKRMTMTVKPARKPSSLPQKRYYWGVIVEGWRELFLECGTPVTPQEVHEYLKREVGRLVKVAIAPDGKRVEMVRSLADLTTAEAENYYTQCRMVAAENGKQIPEPNEPTDFIDEVTGGKEPQLMG